MTKLFDVIIIGAGDVGSSLALALTSFGFSVALIDEKSPKNRSLKQTDNRVLALAMGSQVILERLGVWPLLEKQATAIKKIHVSNRGTFGAVRMQAKDYHCEALGYMVANNDLQLALNQSVEKSEAIEQFCPASFVDFKATDDSAFVTIDKEGEKQTLSASLVVGADGIHSLFREALSIKTINNDFHQKALVTTITLCHAHDQVAYERFLKDSAIALLPHGDKKAALIWSGDNHTIDSLMQLKEQPFIHKLQGDFGYRLGRFDAMTPRLAYPLSEVLAEKCVGPRSVLIGNAAQFLHPIGAQGFNLALRNIALLTDILSMAKASHPAWYDEKILQQYAQEQAKDCVKTRSFTNSLVRFFDDSTLLGSSVVRGSLLNAFNCCPPLKRHLLKGMQKGVEHLLR